MSASAHWYEVGMWPALDGITIGNASQWLAEAKGRLAEGTSPVAGSIAVNTTADDGTGHVAYVLGVNGTELTLDEANLHNNGGVFLNTQTPASEFSSYIYGGSAGKGLSPSCGSGTGTGYGWHNRAHVPRDSGQYRQHLV